MIQYHPGERAIMFALFIGWLLLPVLTWFVGGAFIEWDLAWVDRDARVGIVVFEFWWVLFWGFVAVLA